ncbi:hypothetical protein Tco_1442014, partial [Tanacetum coccineum]
DNVVAPTPSSTIIIPETANEFAIKGNAWLRKKEMLRNCHGHNLSKGNIIKIFYHGLNEITQKALNVAAGGIIFLYKTPNQAYQLLEDKVLLKLDWAKNRKTKSSLKKTVSFADGGSNNSNTNKIMARMDAMTLKMDAYLVDLLDLFQVTLNQTQKDTSSSKPYQLPQARNKHVNVVFTRTVRSYDPPTNPNDSQTLIDLNSDDVDEEPTPQPQTPKPTKEVPIPKPYKPRIPYPQRLRKEKMEAQYGKFLDMIRAINEVIAFGGNTRDLGSILEETGQDCNFTQRRLKEFLTEGGHGIRKTCDAVWMMKRWRYDLL